MRNAPQHGSTSKPRHTHILLPDTNRLGLYGCTREQKNLLTHTGRVHTHAYSEQEEEEGLRALAHISDRALKSRKP